MVIATKSHQRTAEGIMDELEVSLSNLRTDYIDVYQLHNVQTEEQWSRVRAPGGALEAVMEAKEQGRINYVSFHQPQP